MEKLKAKLTKAHPEWRTQSTTPIANAITAMRKMTNYNERMDAYAVISDMLLVGEWARKDRFFFDFIIGCILKDQNRPA